MEEENSLIEQRRANLAALREKGIEPFANKFTPDETCAGARGKYEEGREFSLGRTHDGVPHDGQKHLSGHPRRLGQDAGLRAEKCASATRRSRCSKKLDLGDFIGVKGTMFTTRTEEITLKMAEFTVVGKALRPLPAKWHGLSNIETRYRQRYLDLIANDDVKQVFYKRSTIIREIRDFMHERGFIEVETPTMQAIPGGAAAQPFVTRHNALGCEFYLRIALELVLETAARRRDGPRVRDWPQLPQRGHLAEAQPGVHHARGVPGVRRLRNDDGAARDDDHSRRARKSSAHWSSSTGTPRATSPARSTSPARGGA